MVGQFASHAAMRVSRDGYCSCSQRMRMLLPGSCAASYSRSTVGGVHHETANTRTSSSSVVLPTRVAVSVSLQHSMHAAACALGPGI